MFFQSRVLLRIGLVGCIYVLWGFSDSKRAKHPVQFASDVQKQTRTTTKEPQPVGEDSLTDMVSKKERNDEYSGLRSQKVNIPGTQNITIDAPEGEVMEVELYNMLGALIANSSTSTNRPITNLKEGIFFITITYNDGTKFVQKLVNIGE